MPLHFRDQQPGLPEKAVALSQIVRGRSVIAPVCLRPQCPGHAFRPCGKWAGASGDDLSRTADLRRFGLHRRRPAARETPQSCVARRTRDKRLLLLGTRPDATDPIRRPRGCRPHEGVPSAQARRGQSTRNAAAFWAYRGATPRHGLKARKACSPRCRHLYRSGS